MRLQDNLNILYNQEEGYLVGAAAVSAGESIEPGRSKIDDAGVKLAAAAKLLGLSGEVAVCFSIPYVDHPTYEKSRRRMVEEYCGTEIVFSLFDEEDSIVPTQVYVLPEGLADLYWAQHLGAQFRGKASVVINKGHYSLDCTVVEYDRSSDSIQFNPKASVSLPKGMFQFAQYVCGKLEMPNSNSLRLVEALANPESTIFKYKDKQGFKQVDLAGNLPALKREFSEEVIKDLLNWFPEDIDINDIHLVGGGFEVFAPEVTQMFGEGGYNVNLIQPLRLSSVLSQFLFCQQMTAKSLSL
jgi:plasmid segregation protein ParM